MQNEIAYSRPVTLTNILRFAVPTIAMSVFMSFYTMVDGLFVSNLIGTSALSALNLVYPVIALVTAISTMLATGGSAAIMRKMGEGKPDEAKQDFTFLILVNVLTGLVMCGLGYLFMGKIFGSMSLSPEVSAYCWEYLSRYLLFTVPILLMNNFTLYMIAAGKASLSLLCSVAGGVTNIVLDLVFIVGLRMGVAGAAIATDLSQLVSCVLSLRFLIKSTDDCRVIPREIRLHKKMAARIIRVGLPTGIQNMVISFSNVLVQASVNSYGAAAMAGFAAYMKIDGFNILPVSSISMAATTFVGQNYGAGRLDRVKKGTWVTLAMGLVYTLATGALLLLGQDAIMHLFTNDETVVFFGEAAMHWFCPFYFLLSILHGLAGAVRGTGASVPPMVVLLVSLCLFRVVWIQWVLPLFSGIEGVFILYPVSWALGAGLMILYAWKGKWMEYHA